MSEIVENLVRKNMAIGEVICRSGKSKDEESAPTGDIESHEATRIRRGDLSGDIEHLEKKRKTRRKKTKRKNPYTKNGETRGKRLIKSRVSVKQPVAPYNSNQFLIEDHNDLQDFDVKLMSAANKQTENQDKPEQVSGRTRDASFTSAESDQDYFYSSPEDEEEFLTKEFSNTYQDLHVESLASMSKTDLIQTVLQLEEKIDNLEKELGHKTGSDDDAGKTQDKEKYFEKEISKLVHVNEELQHENEKLRQQTSQLTRTASSEDSESDSSSSSDSTEDEQTSFQNMNGDVHSEDDLTMESDNVT